MVADELAALAIAGLDDPVVCDPACGGGAFLLAAARCGARRLVGIDIDPLAVAVTEAGLWLAGLTQATVLCGDALTVDWPVAPDVVIGNPPFVAAVDRRGTTAYIDLAARFLLAAGQRARRRVVLLQPASTVSASSAREVRAELAPLLREVRVVPDGVFDASVQAVAVVLDRNGAPVVEGDRWAPLLARARGVPSVELATHGTLGDVCDVVAGFRDEYYGLIPHVRERDGAPLITSGLIDPGRCLWGERTARFARRRWEAPAVDVEAAPSWVRRLLVPKVLVATQTPVVEAVADTGGAWVPCTPVISVLPRRLDLGHVLAVLLAPPITAWALHEASGAALSSGALKLSASQLRRVPLPPAGDAWDEAASAAAAGDIIAAGRLLTLAYGADVFDWWQARLRSTP